MKNTLILIRHGETPKNITGTIHKPNDDTELNGLGIKQMKAVGKYFLNNGNYKINQVYSSKTKRTIQSAEIICEQMGLKPIEVNGLQERVWGDLQNNPWEDIEKILSKMTLEERYKFKPKNGESWEEMEKRASDQISEILTNGNTCSAIVSHGGVIRSLIPWLLKTEIRKGLQNIENGSISTFVFENNKLISSEINYTEHLKNLN